MYLEKVLIAFLQRHVNVVIPISIMALRLIVLRLAGDLKEMFRTLFSVPMDLMFISISFVLAALARVLPAFVNRFASPTEADLAGTILVLVLIGLAVAFSYIDRLNRVVSQSFYIALQQLRKYTQQPGFKWSEPDLSVSGRVLFALIYLVALVISFGLELFVSIAALSYVLQQVG